MFRISIIARDSTAAEAAYQCLSERGYACVVVADDAGHPSILSRIAEQPPDLVLMSIAPGPGIGELSRDLKQSANMPIVVLVGRDALPGIESHLKDVDDFVACPFDAAELELRVGRLLQPRTRSEDAEAVNCGDLKIDLARCEVSVSGRPVVLTFKEYELLKHLVTNQGRVCTREALLDGVWGYDYYGGDRTVDVHIRRLRSKLEDPGHTFVETVRNVGYRFRADP